jgi:hypothetical protein
VLAHYGHIDDIPDDVAEWEPDLRRSVRSAPKLAARLAAEREAANLFRVLATLRVDRSLLAGVDALGWRGPTESFEDMCVYLRDPSLAGRVFSLSRSS